MNETKEQAKVITVDGKPMLEEEFNNYKAGLDSKHMIKEVSQGVYKTLQKLEG